MTILATNGADQAILGHQNQNCGEHFPVINAIPRLLLGTSRNSLLQHHASWFGQWQTNLFKSWTTTNLTAVDPADRLVDRFDTEWRDFDEVGTPELSEIFHQYFDVVPREALTPGQIAVDAGCGAGRWAYELAARGVTVIAIDLGLSVEVAHRNTANLGNVVCVQADVVQLPIRRGSVHLAYSLGVLHHIDRTVDALERLVSAVDPGGYCLVYLYHALENRSVLHRRMFRAVDHVRRRTARLPTPLLSAFSEFVALACYLPLARTSLFLRRIGWVRAADAMPLNYYAERSFRVMRNDSLDRFGTALEKRFTRRQVTELMHAAGLVNITVSNSPPYWHAVGQKVMRQAIEGSAG
jgi:SAM-dependent methyltransferase